MIKSDEDVFIRYKQGKVGIEEIKQALLSEKDKNQLYKKWLWIADNNIRTEDLQSMSNFLIQNIANSLKGINFQDSKVIEKYIECYSIKKICETNVNMELFFIDYLLGLNEKYYEKYKNEILNTDFGSCSLFYFKNDNFVVDFFNSDAEKASKLFVEHLINTQEVGIKEILTINTWFGELNKKNIKLSDISSKIEEMLNNALFLYIDRVVNEDEDNVIMLNYIKNIINLSLKEKYCLSDFINPQYDAELFIYMDPIIFEYFAEYAINNDYEFVEKILPNLQSLNEVSKTENIDKFINNAIDYQKKKINEIMPDDFIVKENKIRL